MHGMAGAIIHGGRYCNMAHMGTSLDQECWFIPPWYVS